MKCKHKYGKPFRTGVYIFKQCNYCRKNIRVKKDGKVIWKVEDEKNSIIMEKFV